LKFHLFLSGAESCDRTVPQVVVEAVSKYFVSSFVNLNAGYPQSVEATAVVKRAHELVKMFLNDSGRGEVVLGPNTTQLLRLLSEVYAEQVLSSGDEIIVTDASHEANIGPWVRFDKLGVVTKLWHADPRTGALDLAQLAALLSPRTRIVAIPHVSNILGEVIDVAAVVRLAHAAGAQVVVDGVAFAPHAAPDVQAYGCDWCVLGSSPSFPAGFVSVLSHAWRSRYVYSTYKVFGPHMGALWGSHDAFRPLVGPNFFFIDPASVPYKWELGATNHEGTHSSTREKRERPTTA
jgi:selenocysteine lyase/cysteine desulfurase